MKDTKTIEMLLEVAQSINYHTKQLNEYRIRQTILVIIGVFFDRIEYQRTVKIYERLLLILEKKYNRILKQLNDET